MDVRSLYTNIPITKKLKPLLNNIKTKKPSNKSKHQFSEINIRTEQFYIQLHILFANNRMCNGNKMRSNIRKYLHGYLSGNKNLSINQTKSAITSQIYMTYFSYRQVLKTNYNNLYQKSMKHIPLITKTAAKTSARKFLTILHKKEIDRQSYLHQKSEHPETLKRSIPIRKHD